MIASSFTRDARIVKGRGFWAGVALAYPLLGAQVDPRGLDPAVLIKVSKYDYIGTVGKLFLIRRFATRKPLRRVVIDDCSDDSVPGYLERRLVSVMALDNAMPAKYFVRCS